MPWESYIGVIALPEEEDITECLDCFECGVTMGDDDGDGMRCPQNPDLP